MIMERTGFKDTLQDIVNSGFAVPEGESAVDYIESFLYYIGDPDPELRDDLVYPVFGTWLESGDVYSDETAGRLLAQLSGIQYMGIGLEESSATGSEPSDLVFRRSFSALICGVILYRHLEQPFLTPEQLEDAGSALIDNFRRERDWRSYVPVKGWAHSLAHTADAFLQLLSIPGMSKRFLSEVLDAIAFKLSQDIAVWTGEEDERLVSAIYKAFFENNPMTDSAVLGWIHRLGAALDNAGPESRNVLAINNKHFVRSLYFRGLKYYPESPWLEPLFEAQAQLNRHL